MTDENPDYNKEYYGEKKSFTKTIVTLVAILILGGGIFAYLFPEKIGITGNAIKELNENNSFQFSLESNIPQLKISGDFKKLNIDIFSNQDLIVEDKKISLNQISNSLILEDFSGEIEFNDNSITSLKGKANSILVNNVPIKNERNNKMRISSSSEIIYTFVDFNQNIYLKELNFASTGKFFFGQSAISLANENVSIQDPLGKLTIRNKKMLFEGRATSAQINSQDKVISIAK